MSVGLSIWEENLLVGNINTESCREPSGNLLWGRSVESSACDRIPFLTGLMQEHGKAAREDK